MQPEHKNAAYLWDMLENSRMIAQFTSGISIEEYLKDRKLQLAIERLLEIIGEAAKNVSADFQSKYPEIPWRKIIAQRNVITHEYGEIRQERIWTVVSSNIPELIEKLEPLVETYQQQDNSKNSGVQTPSSGTQTLSEDKNTPNH